MIGSIKGVVDFLEKEYCVVETAGGVGYRVFMSAKQLGQLQTGLEVKLYTYTSVRDDAIWLYGFLTRAEYKLFVLLLGVSGVGPKGAMGVLSGASPDAFYRAIVSKDVRALTRFPGIGKKTAERMLLELKDKVGTISAEGEQIARSGADETEASGAGREAAEALASLGYQNFEITRVLAQIDDYDTLPAEEIIRRALKLFSGRK